MVNVTRIIMCRHVWFVCSNTSAYLIFGKHVFAHSTFNCCLQRLIQMDGNVFNDVSGQLVMWALPHPFPCLSHIPIHTRNTHICANIHKLNNPSAYRGQNCTPRHVLHWNVAYHRPTLCMLIVPPPRSSLLCSWTLINAYIHCIKQNLLY